MHLIMNITVIFVASLIVSLFGATTTTAAAAKSYPGFENVRHADKPTSLYVRSKSIVKNDSGDIVFMFLKEAVNGSYIMRNVITNCTDGFLQLDGTEYSKDGTTLKNIPKETSVRTFLTDPEIAVAASFACTKYREAIAIIGTFSIDKAMEIVYGNHDHKAKTSLWKNIPNHIKGEHLDFPTSEGIASIAFLEHYKEDGIDKAVIVIKVLPNNEQYDCHACAPILGAISFIRKGDRWIIENEDKSVAVTGSYGEPPNIQLVRLGPDKFGILFDSTYSQSGFTTSHRFILSGFMGKFAEVFSSTMGEDARGSCDSDDDSRCNWAYGVKMDFEPGNNPAYFDMKLVTSGRKLNDKDMIVNADETSVYAFDGETYKEVRRSAGPSMPENSVKGSSVTASKQPAMDDGWKRATSFTRHVESETVPAPALSVGDEFVIEHNNLTNPKLSYVGERKIVSLTGDRMQVSVRNLKSDYSRTVYYDQQWNLLATRGNDGEGSDYSPPVKY
jgi:hypothetical protein